MADSKSLQYENRLNYLNFTMNQKVKQNIYDLSREDFAEIVDSLEQPSYRMEQILEWLYKNYAGNFEEMNNVPLLIRAHLNSNYSFHSLQIEKHTESNDGFTQKWLFKLRDGSLIETVLMKYDKRATACISTQAGCAMGCTFCATGQMGFVRNLSHGEIISQAVHTARIMRRSGKRLSNIVFMGMGEPMHNYKNVISAVNTIIDPKLLSIAARKITISTIGIIEGINKLAEEKIQVGLAVSLHGTNDNERQNLIKVASKWNLSELIQSCKNYFNKTGRRVTFEWALIEGVNDSESAAKNLVRLLKGLPCHLNVIPLNPTDNYDGKPSSKERIKVFVNLLNSAGIITTVRMRRGIDIAAGCGQLKAKSHSGKKQLQRV